MKSLSLTSLLIAALLSGGCASTESRALPVVPQMISTYEDTVSYLQTRWDSAAQSVENWSETIQTIQQSPLFVSAANTSNVDRLLTKLRRNTDTELRAQDRDRTARQNDQLREQISPGNPQNAVDAQNEKTTNRIANLEDKQKDQAENEVTSDKK